MPTKGEGGPKGASTFSSHPLLNFLHSCRPAEDRTGSKGILKIRIDGLPLGYRRNDVQGDNLVPHLAEMLV